MTLTSGSGLLYHTYDHYGPHKAVMANVLRRTDR